MGEGKPKKVSLCPSVRTIIKKCVCCKKDKPGTEIDEKWVCVDCNYLGDVDYD